MVKEDLIFAEELRRGLKERLRELERRGEGQDPDPLAPTGRMPEAGTDYVRTFETPSELLARQCEMARVEEALRTLMAAVAAGTQTTRAGFRPSGNAPSFASGGDA